MSIQRERKRGFIHFYGNRKDARTTVIENIDSKFVPIVEIAKASARIPFERGSEEQKKDRRRKMASLFLGHLTPEISSDPKFYKEVNGETHDKILSLLFHGDIIPPNEKDKVEELDKFMQGEANKKIISYLEKLIENRVALLDMNIRDDNYKDMLARHLRFRIGLPSYYIERVYPALDLPLPEKAELYGKAKITTKI